jgi:outer membrane receptor for ferrienterochelin and colicin
LPIHVTPAWLVLPSVRADYYSEMRESSVDPRLSTRYDTALGPTLKAAAGLYSQPGQYWESMEAFGNPALEPSRTLQTSVGIEQQVCNSCKFDVEAFYKQWSDRVVPTPGGVAPRYVNTGTGKAYGLELLLDTELWQGARGLLSYTLSRSTRKDGPSEPTRLFDRDQTHNLQLAANWDIGAGFSAGARFRYVTGNPYSAVEGAVYDANTDTYRPLYGALNASRNAAFHQLDLRLEKVWRPAPVELTAYVEVMNAYNANNEEGRRYSYDYSESASVSGMPLFPNIGLRGAL